MPPHRLGGARQRAERDGFVVGVEQAIELSPARLHSFRQGRFRQPLILHQRVELTRDDALDRARGHLFIDAFLLQELVEGRADMAFLFHVMSFRRFVAKSRSATGVFCFFLMNPWSSTMCPSCT